MRIVVNSRPAAVKAGFSLLQRLKRLFFTAKCVVKSERHDDIIEKNSNKYKITIVHLLFFLMKMKKNGILW
jgi:hypothetical protein